MKLPKTKIKKLFSGGLVLGLSLLSVVSATHAAPLTSSSLLLSTSRPQPQQSVAAVYSVRFTTATQSIIGCIQVTFNTAAQFTSVTAPVGMDVKFPAGTGTAAAFDTSFNTTGYNIGGVNSGYSLSTASTNVLKFTSATTDPTLAGQAVRVDVTNMTNPTTPGTYYARYQTFVASDCSGTAVDSAVIAYAIASGVTVSATIDPILTFSVTGIGASAEWKSTETTYGANTSANCDANGPGTQVNFPASMAINTNYTCAQKLTVSTNAAGGYSVTLRGTNTALSAPFLRSGPNSVADLGASNAIPGNWASIGNAFAYSSTDVLLSGGTQARFSGDNKWAAVGFSAEEVAWNANPVDTEETNIGYRLRFNATQQAGAYQGTIIYVATPTF